MNPRVRTLEAWIDEQARRSVELMLRAVSATSLVMDRPQFAQRVIPLPGSVLASPVRAHYDPEPDYFYHWFRDSSVVMDALRVALLAGWTGAGALDRFGEFVHFSQRLLRLDGREALRVGPFGSNVEAEARKFLRPESEVAALNGVSVLADVRVNADGTPDMTRWSRPQYDGPALRALVMSRWLRDIPLLQSALRESVREVLAADLSFTLAHLAQPSFDIWEEEQGQHYYTLLAQSEACTQAASVLAQRASECIRAACTASARLDDFWDPAAGIYRSRGPGAATAPEKALDIAVILAVLHVSRPDGEHSVLDPKVQATLDALEDLFASTYAINRALPPDRGPAMGRYADDRYFSGGAYYFATLAAAEFHYRLAAALRAGTHGGQRGAAALSRGDSFMRTVQTFTPADGELSEQFDQRNGSQTSARQLSWSYAAFITAAASRERALGPVSPPGA